MKNAALVLAAILPLGAAAGDKALPAQLDLPKVEKVIAAAQARQLSEGKYVMSRAKECFDKNVIPADATYNSQIQQIDPIAKRLLQNTGKLKGEMAKPATLDAEALGRVNAGAGAADVLVGEIDGRIKELRAIEKDVLADSREAWKLYDAVFEEFRKPPLTWKASFSCPWLDPYIAAYQRSVGPVPNPGAAQILPWVTPTDKSRGGGFRDLAVASDFLRKIIDDRVVMLTQYEATIQARAAVLKSN